MNRAISLDEGTRFDLEVVGSWVCKASHHDCAGLVDRVTRCSPYVGLSSAWPKATILAKEITHVNQNKEGNSQKCNDDQSEVPSQMSFLRRLYDSDCRHITSAKCPRIVQ